MGESLSLVYAVLPTPHAHPPPIIQATQYKQTRHGSPFYLSSFFFLPFVMSPLLTDSLCVVLNYHSWPMLTLSRRRVFPLFCILPPSPSHFSLLSTHVLPVLSPLFPHCRLESLRKKKAKKNLTFCCFRVVCNIKFVLFVDLTSPRRVIDRIPTERYGRLGPLPPFVFLVFSLS